MGKTSNRIKKIRIASLFSGCGGMDLGTLGGFKFLGNKYEPLRTEVVYANDIDKNACSIYGDNFDHEIECADMKSINYGKIPDHEILTGGFPCQSFSIVAQNPPRLGYKNQNGRLFFDMCKILEKKKPEVFIAENVKGILSANKGQAFPLILSTFERTGYHVKYTVLNASDFGIPQKRERVFMVGFRDFDKYMRFQFPKPVTELKKVPLSSVLIPEEQIDEKFFFTRRAVEGLKQSRGKNGDMNKGRAQNVNEPCNTVGAHLAKVSLNSTDPVLYKNERFRMFTPREVARIQSFPDSFALNVSKTAAYKALGNAVPPVLMWHLTREILKVLK